MNGSIPNCRSITVYAFRGDRSRAFTKSFLTELRKHRTGVGSGPSMLDCMAYLGHAGVSMDGGLSIFGFSPRAILPFWHTLAMLRNGERFPGIVQDDIAVFTAARIRGAPLGSFDLIFPEPEFHKFKSVLDAEKQSSQYAYGFPNGDGDCNCITWLERMGLPLHTGRLEEFVYFPWRLLTPSRRFGRCV